ncbi:hypothetical protein PLIIFM63780_005332 [Purpureocillium lilacinum]|nr:hypothetical protein PLIIFM63780_005332 [Purpureocillium lilacinum]
MSQTVVESASYVPDTYHQEEVPAGCVEGHIGVDQLRKAIPKHCFQPSLIRSLAYVVQDVALLAAPLAATLCLERQIDHPTYKFLLCAVLYPFVVGIPGMGLWVLGHEAGHGAFCSNRILGDAIGFLIHSFLMSPFFSWRSTHSRHHIYTNHLAKDHIYVPPKKDDYKEMIKGKVSVEEITEDAPIVLVLRLIVQQVCGWPTYLFTHISSGDKAALRPSTWWWSNSHFDPWGTLFRADEFWSVVASDVGLLGMCFLLYKLAGMYGWWTVTWAYILPLMWVNHYIVIITYLHHTHPDLPKFAEGSWTYLRGALSTVDRDPGFVLRHLMHHIVDLHVVHHLFPKIPHYHAQEATDAIRPLLGKYYHQDNGPWYGALYENFRDCRWVETDANVPAMERIPKGRAAQANGNSEATEGIYWYRPGNLKRR